MYLLGRTSEYKKTREKYLQQYQKEMDLLCKNLSLRQVNAITGTSVTTLRKIISMFKDDFPELGKRTKKTLPAVLNN